MNSSPPAKIQHTSMRIFLAGLVLVAIFLGQGLYFIASNAQTFDEAVHLTAGYSYLVTGDFRLNGEHPPLIKQLCALPVWLWYRLPFNPDPALWEEARSGEDRPQWYLSPAFLYGSTVPADRILALARVPNLLLGGCLVALIGWWAYRLWGAAAALLAMSLAAFEPNLIANASLITTDLGVTLFTFLTFYLLWEYAARPSRGLSLASGIALGLALVSKFSGVMYVGITALTIGIYLLCGGTFPLSGSGGDTGPKTLPQRLRQAAPTFLRIVCLALLVILPFYFFQGYSTWAFGLRTQMNQQTTGKAAFFLGEYSEGGWWSYFLVAFLIKTPVGSLLLIAAALLCWRAGEPWQRRDAVFLLAPVAATLLALTQLRLNIGLRYALPIYPFLLVAASRLATVRYRPAWLAPVLVGIPLAWTGASALRVAPHQLAYFNELVGGPGEGYRYLTQSCLDWGQDLRGVKAYMDREGLPMIYFSYQGTAPVAYYGIRSQYLPSFGQLGPAPTDELPEDLTREVLAISVVNLQGVHCEDRDMFRWLYQRTPIARIGYSIFVYDLTGDADAHCRLAEVYTKVGLPSLAEAELRRAQPR
jgi:hypothetical protein